MQESALVSSIKGWLARDWQVELYHIDRRRNQVANRVAARDCNSERTAVLLPLPPMEIRRLVEEEMRKSNSGNDDLVRRSESVFDPGAY
ncbi:hypothetical protein V6N12_042729 [Hibiscus sabdariffa]